MSETNPLTIVTGGAGFIGSHLVERLVNAGRRVRVVEHPEARVDHLPPQVEIVRADIRDRDAIRAAVRDGGDVYHLAANPNLWARDPREFDAVNHQGTIHVLDAAIEAGARRILHCSTESILTRARSDDPIDENVEVDEHDAVGPYCLSKLRAEKAAMARARAGHPVWIANPTMPIGPGDYRVSPPTRLIVDFCQRKLLARMDCSLNVIDVRDVALGLERCLERGRAGSRYLLGGANLSLVELLGMLSELTGVPVPRWNVPSTVGLAIAYVSEFWANTVSGRSPKATITGIRLAQRKMHFDNRKTREALDLHPRPTEIALRDAVDWLRSRGIISVSCPSRANSLNSAR